MRVALAVLHAPWLEERAGNMRELRQRLGVDVGQQGGRCGDPDAIYREFTERAPWPERILVRWRWALSTGAEHFLQLEDDVLVAPHFWPSLRAMQAAWGPGDVLCLAATHSMAPLSVAGLGRRSYVTPRLIGWA